MKTFKIDYEFAGYGEVEIKAKNKEEAIELFDERDWDNANEWSENTTLETIEEVK